MLPEVWTKFLAGYYDEAAFQATLQQVAGRRAVNPVYPPDDRLFRALELTPPDAVKVVIFGQDPYHEAGQAQGLAFSVPDDIKIPPSLRNIFKEYASDLGRTVPQTHSLEKWARGGVLLLNAVLSVDAGHAHSHSKLGWTSFTDAIVRALSAQKSGLVFILWGSDAIAKKSLIDLTKHHTIESVHPSPLSAYRGFFGSRPFSRAEALLPGWHWPELD